MSRQDMYDAYNQEVEEVEQEFNDGKITSSERTRFLENLYNNLQSDLSEDEQ